jgi:hypothetical protein
LPGVLPDLAELGLPRGILRDGDRHERRCERDGCKQCRVASLVA